MLRQAPRLPKVRDDRDELLEHLAVVRLHPVRPFRASAPPGLAPAMLRPASRARELPADGCARPGRDDTRHRSRQPRNADEVAQLHQAMRLGERRKGRRVVVRGTRLERGAFDLDVKHLVVRDRLAQPVHLVQPPRRLEAEACRVEHHGGQRRVGGVGGLAVVESERATLPGEQVVDLVLRVAVEDRLHLVRADLCRSRSATRPWGGRTVFDCRSRISTVCGLICPRRTKISPRRSGRAGAREEDAHAVLGR